MLFVLFLCALSVCFGQICPNQLSGPCPTTIIGDWRVFEIQKTGQPILNNLIKLAYTVMSLFVNNFYISKGAYFIFNETGTGIVTIASVNGCNSSVTGVGSILSDNTLQETGIPPASIRSIFREEGVNKARQVMLFAFKMK